MTDLVLMDARAPKSGEVLTSFMTARDRVAVLAALAALPEDIFLALVVKGEGSIVTFAMDLDELLALRALSKAVDGYVAVRRS